MITMENNFSLNTNKIVPRRYLTWPIRSEDASVLFKSMPGIKVKSQVDFKFLTQLCISYKLNK